MKTLRILINRRRFLQLFATLPVILAGLRSKTSVANLPQPAFTQSGYGVGAYGHSIYPGMSSNVYLPLISKVQE